MVERPRPLMPRDNSLDGNYIRQRDKQKKEKTVKSNMKSNEKVNREYGKVHFNIFISLPGDKNSISVSV